MSSINLYKIDDTKVDVFKKALKEKMSTTNQSIKYTNESNGSSFDFCLYTKFSSIEKEIKWNWLLNEFDVDSKFVNAYPQAVLIAQKETGSLYAITYGHAFFLVDKYCDMDFVFSVARRMDFDEIKTTTLTTPNSKRNKTVNTYIDYSELEFDSGESFAKIKVKANLPEDFDLFKPSVEIGTSIRLVTDEDSLSRIANILSYIEDILMTKDIKYRIPVFSKVKDSQRIEMLEQHLNERVQNNPEVYISELDIVGVTEVFNHNDSNYVLKYLNKRKKVDSLTPNELRDFCEENGWDIKDVILDIVVDRYIDGTKADTTKVRQLIDFTVDEEKCVLSKGLWYQYNDDYLSYLRDSISEIAAEYHPEYDFSNTMHEEFIETLLPEERLTSENVGMSDAEVRSKLTRKYYYERAFNIIMERDHGFKNHDRDDMIVEGAKVEITDLYKDGTMFAVKVGNASSKLCYAVDQSFNTLRLYKHNRLEMPQINSAAIWLILTRKSHIERNGVPDINLLDMLMLKNKLDQWKKEVRLQGLKPIIYVNYKT